MHRILYYAKKQGYTAYTSTLVEAWRISIQGLTQSLLNFLNMDDIDFGPETKFSDDPVAQFGMLEADLHRSRGITYEMFVGLMKYYRQSYLDLTYEKISGKDRPSIAYIVDRFFDRIEVGFTMKWLGTSEGEHLKELQERNRIITNEKNKFLTIFESLQSPAIVFDTEGHFTNGNHAALYLFFGIDTPGKKYYEYASPNTVTLEVPDWLSSDLAEVAGNQGTEMTKTREVSTTVGKRTFEIRYKKMLDVSDKFSWITVIFNDITTHQELEQALTERNKELEQFAYIISHDLKAPLRGMMTLSQFLIEDYSDALDEQGQELLETLVKRGQSMKLLIEGILDYTKASLAKEGHVKEWLDVEAEVKDVLSVLQPEPTTKIEIERDTLPPVQYNKIQFTQVLSNLLSNAIKFAEKNNKHSARVIVRGREDDDYSYIEVQDNGPGINPKYHNKIFELFQTVEQDQFSTGVGLAIVKKIVQMNGGKIIVRSSGKGGSVFAFSIPRKKDS